MATYDQGGGCPCGLQKTCTPDCSLYQTYCTHTWVYDGTGGGHRGEYVHKCSKCGKEDWFAHPKGVVNVPANTIPQRVNLGAKLAATLDELEKAKIKGLEQQANADLEKIRKERASLSHLKDETIATITAAIEAGRVPHIKVKDYTRQEWIRKAIKSGAAHQDIWNELTSWARANALVVIAKEDHDGVGIESWISLTVHPVRPGTRSYSWENKE